VLSELDEMDREEFFRCVIVINYPWNGANYIYRLKKVQGKKKRDVAARESARAAEQEDNIVVEAHEPAVDDEGGGDLLSSKDEDVIF
jgi:V-type H+-transporting ATPase subunit D